MLLNFSCMLLVSLNLIFSAIALGDPPKDDIDRSLIKGSSSAWYDEDEQTLTFPTAQSLQAAEDLLKDRHQNIYAEQPPTSNSPAKQAWWDPIVESLSALAPWLLWGLLALFLISLAVYLWFAVERGDGVRLRRRDPQAGEVWGRENAKLVDLPFSIDAPSRSLYEQAQVFRRDGEFSQSIIYLFSHILVELDNANCIRLQRGKTNQIYLQELQKEPKLGELYQQSVRVFEAIFFGRYAVDQEQCERYWSLLPTIQQSIQEAIQRRTASNTQNPSGMVSQSKSLAVGGIKTLGLFLLASMMGCSNPSNRPLDQYGGSNVYSRKSVSGLTVFRELCEQRQLRTNELSSLSERSHRLDTIVWAPKDFRVPNEQEIEWFDDWLSNHPARKLIWVGRDYSPASHYWERATERAAPEDRRTYRLQQAYADSEFESARIRSVSPLKCAWFEQQLGKNVGRRVERFQGPWAKDLDVEESDIVLRGKLFPVQAARTDTSTRKPLVERPRIQTWLASDDGSPIVSSLSYPRWGESQCILIANGSVLMNESLTHRGNLRMAERLIDQCTPNGRIGFLSNVGETRIRQPGDKQEPKGFEWLRVWPLSLIAIQALFIGSIALLAMLPIFGRPQRLPSPSTTDFGKHIEALGDLLAQTRDRNYALHRIADYFRDVRRDSASPWSTVTTPATRDSSKKDSATHDAEPPSLSTTTLHSTHEIS